MERTVFNADKMYTYIRGYASGAGMKQTLKALSFAREKHEGQKRKNGDPYLIHPLIMACKCVKPSEFRMINVVATILLHDVCEDCGVSLSVAAGKRCCAPGSGIDDFSGNGRRNQGKCENSVL